MQRDTSISSNSFLRCCYSYFYRSHSIFISPYSNMDSSVLTDFYRIQTKELCLMSRAMIPTALLHQLPDGIGLVLADSTSRGSSHSCDLAYGRTKGLWLGSKRSMIQRNQPQSTPSSSSVDVTSSGGGRGYTVDIGKEVRHTQWLFTTATTTAAATSAVW